MDDSTPKHIIVNHTQVVRALGDRAEAAVEEAAPEGGGPDWEAKLFAFRRGVAELRQRETAPDVLSTADHEAGALLQSFLAEYASQVEGGLRSLPGHDGGDPQPPGLAAGEEVALDGKDYAGWIKSFFTWWGKIVRHPWVPAPAAPESLGDEVRVAVLGDWGSGLYGAPKCSESIAADAKGYGLLLHLGDVYYSGTPREVGTRFLRHWPRVLGATSRALNANHEMYSGGYGYFDVLLNAIGQPSSVFALQNASFLLVGLDTGYVEHDLAHGQEAWLSALIEAAGSRKVVLFSHHQPYSLFEHQGPVLQKKLGSLLAAKKIAAWYWGHEHRCVIYDRHPTWDVLGRCIGHGGYPYLRDDFGAVPLDATLPGGHAFRRVTPALARGAGKECPVAGRVLDGTNPYVIGHEQKYGPHGYVTLELSGPTLREILHAPDGTVLYEEQIL